jgi:isoleucyl-tRNA synthetase
VFDGGLSIFTQTYWDFGPNDETLLARWARIREVREAVNKAIEDVRTAGRLGSSLQANVVVTAPLETHALLAALGEDLKFVLITSTAKLLVGTELKVTVTPSPDTKCERCWHYRDDVGLSLEHPGLCGRCVSNLYGSGERRTVA